VVFGSHAIRSRARATTHSSNVGFCTGCDRRRGTALPKLAKGFDLSRGTPPAARCRYIVPKTRIAENQSTSIRASLTETESSPWHLGAVKQGSRVLSWLARARNASAASRYVGEAAKATKTASAGVGDVRGAPLRRMSNFGRSVTGPTRVRSEQKPAGNASTHRRDHPLLHCWKRSMNCFRDAHSELLNHRKGGLSLHFRL